MNQQRPPTSTQFRPTLQFSAYRPILAKWPRRSILRREVVKFIVDDTEKWAKVVKFSGAKAD
jgi:hypothetical protein